MYNPWFGQQAQSRTVYYLVAINVAVFFLQITLDGFTEFFSLTPAIALGGAYWQFFTYMFLHGGIWHILINMFVLLVFGIPVESALGTRRFLTLYFAAGIFSALFYTILTGPSMILMLGASGAVYAVLAAYGFKFPESIIFVGFFFPIKAKYAVIMFAFIEFFVGTFELQTGVANFGHLGGIIAGVAIMLYWRQKKRNQRSSHFQNWEFYWE